MSNITFPTHHYEESYHFSLLLREVSIKIHDPALYLLVGRTAEDFDKDPGALIGKCVSSCSTATAAARGALRPRYERYVSSRGIDWILIYVVHPANLSLLEFGIYIVCYTPTITSSITIGRMSPGMDESSCFMCF